MMSGFYWKPWFIREILSPALNRFLFFFLGWLTKKKNLHDKTTKKQNA